MCVYMYRTLINTFSAQAEKVKGKKKFLFKSRKKATLAPAAIGDWAMSNYQLPKAPIMTGFVRTATLGYIQYVSVTL